MDRSLIQIYEDRVLGMALIKWLDGWESEEDKRSFLP